MQQINIGLPVFSATVVHAVSANDFKQAFVEVIALTKITRLFDWPCVYQKAPVCGNILVDVLVEQSCYCFCANDSIRVRSKYLLPATACLCCIDTEITNRADKSSYAHFMA